MQALKSSNKQRAGCLILSALLAFPTFALAQEPPAPPPAPSGDAQAVPAPPPLPTVAPTSGGWKRVGDQSSQSQQAPTPDMSTQQPPAQPNGNAVQAPPPPSPPPADANGNVQQGPPPNGYPSNGQPNYGPPPAYGPQNQGGYNQGPPPQGYPQQQPAYNQQPVPATLTVAPGTYLTVRINQLLSSDRNQVGDAFWPLC